MSVKLEGNGFTEVRGRESTNVAGGCQCEKGGQEVCGEDCREMVLLMVKGESAGMFKGKGC